MSLNRILVIVAVVCFAIVTLSAFSTEINVNETGWLALGLAAWAGSTLALGINLGNGAGFRTARRPRVLR